MKVLSLLQPWATLVVIGAKKFETRSWATKYRGPLLIHASKRKPRECLTHQWPFSEYVKGCGRDLPRGVIIGQVELRDCVTTETWIVQHNVLQSEWVQEEYRFGDYSAGRFAWKLENFYKFVEPISVKGSLGIWEFPESALGHLAEAGRT